jgi:DNA topoisomerase-1
MPNLDFGMINAGKTRHEVDWLYGINLSRALTNAANQQKRGYNTLSTGRVQGPTLKFLVTRECSIQTFEPTPYWSILAEIDVNGRKYRIDYEKEVINKKDEADAVVQACSGKTGTVENIEQKTTQTPPPFPFDLGSLQRQAYSLFGYTPRQTGDIAERLYLDALISYPRTSSQKLPPTINYKAILDGLSQETTYQRHATELLHNDNLVPRQGPNDDPAHPAIYPTGNRPQRPLTQGEHRIRDLIVRRFMAVFGKPEIKQNITADINVNGYHFYIQGRKILKEGWITSYKPYVHTEEVQLPPIEEGQTAQVSRVLREDKFTKPPPRYNPSSLLRRMEKEGIGTKATRADTIETLYKRKYITGKSITVTDLGNDVTKVLHDHAPAVVSIKLTRDLEEQMEHIQRGTQKPENVLVETIERLKPVLTELKNKESAIGETLGNALRQMRIQERIIGPCPTCHSGKLMILRSKRTGKRFIGCTNYFKNTCRTSFPLPQQGIVKPSGRPCKNCGWPQLFIHISGRHAWNLCFNPDCSRNRLRKGMFKS